MSREHGEIRVGDVIEFGGDREGAYHGVITNIIENTGDLLETCIIGDRSIASLVVQQASDGKFAVWEPRRLGDFKVTFRRVAN